MNRMLLVFLLVLSLTTLVNAAPQSVPAGPRDSFGLPNPRGDDPTPYQPGEHYPPGTPPCGPQYIPHCYMQTPPNETVIWPLLLFLLLLVILFMPFVGIGFVAAKVYQNRYRKEVAARVARAEQRNRNPVITFLSEQGAGVQAETVVPLATSLPIDDPAPEE